MGAVTGKRWDAVVIGTGFGGSMTALMLVRAGMRVLLLERGRWVDRDESAWDPRAILIHRKYRSLSPFEAQDGKRRAVVHPDEAVGGKSVFYGAASFRLRVEDFELRSRLEVQDPEVASRFVDWPIRYADLEPFYDEAERLLSVVGVAGLDPTEPPRSRYYPEAPPPYGSSARHLVEAARSLGLRPFPIPLAINFNGRDGRAHCIQCMTCDLFPCRISAKNDLSVSVVPEALTSGAVLRHSTVARRLVIERGRVRGVECIDTSTGEEFTVHCDLCVVSGGAIGTAALLLASGLGHMQPNGRWVGRYLLRHCSGVRIGIFPFRTNPEQQFHKQVAITDFYFGDPDGGRPRGPWGMIQALQVAPPEFIAADGNFGAKVVGSRTTERQIYLMCIAQDVPDPRNRIELDPTRRDPLGLPIARVSYVHDRRDVEARRALYRVAGSILRRAGAWFRFRHDVNTFSHALGTCRFGTDPETAVLDPSCRFFGIRNLFVVDGSFMPTSGAVNPSLTIAANALRVGRHIAENWDSIVRHAAAGRAAR